MKPKHSVSHHAHAAPQPEAQSHSHPHAHAKHVYFHPKEKPPQTYWVVFFHLMICVIAVVAGLHLGPAEPGTYVLLTAGAAYAALAILLSRRSRVIHQFGIAVDVLTVLALIIALTTGMFQNGGPHGKGSMLGIIPMMICITLPIAAYVPAFRQSYIVIRRGWLKDRRDPEVEAQPGWDEANHR